MKNSIYLLLLIAGVNILKAQVGVNTTSPKSTLDINGSLGTPIKTVSANYTVLATDHTIVLDGTVQFTITLPAASTCIGREYVIINTDNVNNLYGSIIQDPILVGGRNLIQAQSIDHIKSDGTNWIIVNSGYNANIYNANGIVSSNRTIAQQDKTVNFTSTATTGTSHFTIDGTTINVNAVSNSVGIGTASPDASSVLDVTSTNKGILIPRVNLTSNTLDLDGVAGQASGLLIYNTGSTFQTGFYYWNGSEWRNINNSTTVPPAITDIKCNTAILSPSTYTSGVPYAGIMTITYSGGNGGSFSDQTPISSTGVTGLIATLSSGQLNNGSGTFTYQIAGTPNASSPNTANFLLPTTFGGTGCTATVGLGDAFSVGETRSFRVAVNAASLFANNTGNRTKASNATGSTITITDNASYDLASAANKAKYIVLNGLRMDFTETPFNGNNVSPVLYNTTSSSINFSLSSLSTNDLNIDGANTTLPANTYSYRVDGDDNFGLSASGTSPAGGRTEYVNAMLTFPSGEWYQLTYHATRDATNVYLYMTALRLN